LRAVQNSRDVQDIFSDLVDDDKVERWNHQFTGSRLFTGTTAIWESLQYGWRILDSAYQLRGVLGCLLKEVIGDVF
jgi:hypothetical protein